jgi:hypothetical protein
MNKKYLIWFVSFIIFATILFVGVKIYSKSSEATIEDKIDEEINYLQTQLLSMLNSINNLSSTNILIEEKTTTNSESQNSENSSETSKSSSNSKSSNQEEISKYTVSQNNILTNLDTNTNWDYMKNTVENLYSTWTSIMIDLNSANIKNEDILNFSNNLDILIVNIENENKQQTLNTLAILYGFIPKYIEQYANDTEKINIAYTKLYVINSYAMIEENRWADMNSQINKAKEYYDFIINSINDEQYKQNKISKIYVLLNEITNAINLKDKKLYYIKYVNLMENLAEL